MHTNSLVYDGNRVKWKKKKKILHLHRKKKVKGDEKSLNYNKYMHIHNIIVCKIITKICFVLLLLLLYVGGGRRGNKHFKYCTYSLACVLLQSINK